MKIIPPLNTPVNDVLVAKYKSDQYTIFVRKGENHTSVVMACNQTKYPHSLSNLPLAPYDLTAQNLRRLGSAEINDYFRDLIIEGDIAKLNKITNGKFVAMPL